MIAGFDLDLDSQQFVTTWNEAWPEGHTGAVLGFQLSSAEAVDGTCASLTGAGYVGQQAPVNAFMGAR